MKSTFRNYVDLRIWVGLACMGFVAICHAGGYGDLSLFSGITPEQWTNAHSPGNSNTRAVRNGGTGSGSPGSSWPAILDETYSSPFFADVTGDGIMEIIAGDRSDAYVYDIAGNLLPGWPKHVSGYIFNHGAVGDIDGDGAVEIAFGLVDVTPRLIVFESDGSLVPGFPVSLPRNSFLNVSCPVIADLDGDGEFDVGIQSDLGISFFNGQGQALPGWPYTWIPDQNIVWAGPSVADIDGDGMMEVAVGNNNFNNPQFHVIRADGSAMPGWPQNTGGVFASCALADLDRDDDLEIIVQDGWPGDTYFTGGWLYVWHHDGEPADGWPKQLGAEWEGSPSNPAVSDIDNDGIPEIISCMGNGILHIFKPDGTYLDGYPKTVCDRILTSPAVVDLDGDNIGEIFLNICEGNQQIVAGWRLDGSTVDGFPKVLGVSEFEAQSSCHLADMNGDGAWDLTACSSGFMPYLWVFELEGSVHMPGVTRAEWPKLRRDIANTGLYVFHIPGPTPTTPPPVTSTPDPTGTPTQIPTIYPTEIPTQPPTLTPIPSYSPAPTFTPQIELGVRVDLPQQIHPGQKFYIHGYLDNPEESIPGVLVFFFLDIAGDYWFWDSWSHYSPGNGGTMDFDTRDVPQGTTKIIVLPEFDWPDTGSSSASGLRFWGAMVEPDMTAVIGNYDMKEFGYGPGTGVRSPPAPGLKNASIRIKCI
ncbi:VCBS repeat-containing protein [bacterium]|nr:VCBS repeat-containing protein [candidate division CSSED10-310 bacterium]